MKQVKLYARDITKDIDGVVKATDLTHEILLDEIQEYVLTNELMRANMLPRLFSELSSNTFNKSIWISGHFGSGKSHLLKILSLVLSNKELLGQSSAEIFSKKYAQDEPTDFEFAPSVMRAAAIPTETILFNIQSKNDGITSSSADPVLAIFAKVFNEHLGYSTNAKIADFERYLDDKGEYERFKELYASMHGKPWTEERERILLTPQKCAETFAQIEGISKEEATTGIRDSVRNYTLDSDTFAKLIKSYLDKEPKNARLIFCVDEVGQYIAEDTEKMLSLQTITENISNLTAGKAFAIVTSQNDLSATVGDFNRKQQNDFSKITGRFAFKVALTSANADEVIQKRLLSKTDEGKAVLNKVYTQEQNNLKTILRFEGETPFNIQYKDTKHFADTYPFVSYQFALLQSAINELQKNNAFIGSHQSLGERSMLSICQKVVQKYANESVDSLVSFGAMFEGLSDMFQSNVISDITQANSLLKNRFSVEVLKTLFLVKYEKRLKTTLNNIAVLMLPQFDADLVEFKKRLQESLNELVQKNYIQRTAAGVYEYLTNQEKDIENEIKNTEISFNATLTLVQSTVFGELYTQPKIQIGTSRYQLFEYGKKCDGNVVGQEKEIYLHIITPFCGDLTIRNNIQQYAMRNSTDLIVLFPENAKLADEIHLYEQTKKYISTTHTAEHEALKMAIIADKRAKNDERIKIITEMLRDGLDSARLFIFGNEVLATSNANSKDKISQGLIELVQSTYTNLRMLQADYTDDSIQRIVKEKDDLGLVTELSEAEAEIMNKMQRSKANHERTTIKALMNDFRSRPYGWYNNAVLSLIAQLYKRAKITLKRDGKVLNESEVIQSLTNNRLYDYTLVEIEDVIHPSQVAKLKSFYQEYFGRPCVKIEARDIATVFAEDLNAYIKQIEAYYKQANDSKFLACLNEPLLRLKQVADKVYPTVYTDLASFEDNLLDDKEDILDKVEAFMSGTQFQILKEIAFYLNRHNANLNYLTEGHLEKLKDIYNSDAPYKGSVMQEAKTHLEAMKAELTKLQDTERTKALETIAESKTKLTAIYGYTELDDSKKSELLRVFIAVEKEVKDNQFIANMRERASHITNEYYNSCINKINAWLTPPTPQVAEPGDEENTDKPKVKHITYVTKNSIKIDFTKPTLDTKEDVENYVETLKKRYLKLLEEDKRISL